MKFKSITLNVTKLLSVSIMILLGLISALGANNGSYPHDTYDLAKMKINPIANSDVMANYIQCANLVDYDDGMECQWFISDSFEIGKDRYCVLVRERYYVGFYYLCRLSDESVFPQTLLLCTSIPSGETSTHFVIDEEKDTITLVSHENVLPYSSAPTADGRYIETFDIAKMVYRLSSYSFIEESHCQKEMDIEDVYILL